MISTMQDVRSAPDQPHATLLDNPIWNALRTDHATIALGDDRARRYPPYIGPLSGIAEESADCYEALKPLAGPGGVIALFLLTPPQPRTGWNLTRTGFVDQMICTSQEKFRAYAKSLALKGVPALDSGKTSTPGAPSLATASSSTRVGDNEPLPVLRQLTADDAPDMVALAELTEPGPFRLRTLELGNFWGIFHDDRLMAMAGKRMHIPGVIEVSGVCTHPDARGRSYAGILMASVMKEIFAAGRTPILHTFADNVSAIRVYEKLGFTRRQTFHLAVLKNEG